MAKEVSFKTRTTFTSKSLPEYSINSVLTRERSPRNYLENKKRFSEGKELGSGGMAIVYDVLDEYFQRHIAYKILKLDKNPDLRIQEFLREAQVMAQLEHPGIAPIYELNSEEGKKPRIAMAKVDGLPLSEKIIQARKKPEEWPLQDRIQVFIRLVEILSYAHHKKIVHRDIKPANIMVGKYGEVTLLDWGLAKVQNIKEFKSHHINSEVSMRVDESITGAIKGTPYYMSPETAGGQVQLIDEQSDIFSVGAIFFEMITLKHLIKGSQTMEVLKSARAARHNTHILDQASSQPQKSTGYRKVPVDLIYIMKKCIEPDRSRRYRTGEALLKDIQNYQNNLPLEHFKTTLLTRSKKWLNRNGMSLIVFVIPTIFILLLLTFLAGLSEKLYHENQNDLLRKNALLNELKQLKKNQSVIFRKETQLEKNLNSIKSKIEKEQMVLDNLNDQLIEQSFFHQDQKSELEEWLGQLNELQSEHKRLDESMQKTKQLMERKYADKKKQVQEISEKLYFQSTPQIAKKIQKALRAFQNKNFHQTMKWINQRDVQLDPFVGPMLKSKFINASKIKNAPLTFFKFSEKAPQPTSKESAIDEMAGFEFVEDLPQGYEIISSNPATHQSLCKKRTLYGVSLMSIDQYTESIDQQWSVDIYKISKALPYTDGWYLLEERQGYLYHLPDHYPSIPVIFKPNTQIIDIYTLPQFNLLVSQANDREVFLSYLNSGMMIISCGVLEGYIQSVYRADRAIVFKLNSGKHYLLGY